jgi:predicted RNase H-like HicB family nuclease
MENIKIVLEKDSEGYIARLEGYDNIFAHGYTPFEALEELKNVLEMFKEYEEEKTK